MTQAAPSNTTSNENVDRLLILEPGSEINSVVRFCRKFGIETEVMTKTTIPEDWAKQNLDNVVVLEKNLSFEDEIKAVVELANQTERTLLYLGSNCKYRHEITKTAKERNIPVIGQTNSEILSLKGQKDFRDLAEENSIRSVPSFLTDTIDSSLIQNIQSHETSFDFPICISVEEDQFSSPIIKKIVDEEEFSKMLPELKNGKSFLVEPFFSYSRVLEVPILLHPDGTILTFMEREQSLLMDEKLCVQESPSPALKQHHQGEAIRELLFQYTIKLALLAKIEGFVTARFLFDAQSKIRFHGMSEGIFQGLQEIELLHGIDPIDLQIQTALGNKLPESVHSTQPTGHVLTSFVYTENANKAKDNSTSDGTRWAPGSPNRQRIDVFFPTGNPNSQDLLSVIENKQPIAQVITHDHVRHRSILRMDRLLATMSIEPFMLNTTQIRSILNRESFRAGQYDLSTAST